MAQRVRKQRARAKKSAIPLMLHSWRDGREIPIKALPGERMMDLIRRAGFQVDGVLVMAGGEPVPIDEELTDAHAGLTFTVIRVASGG